jgi:hypothetical protein
LRALWWHDIDEENGSMLNFGIETAKKLHPVDIFVEKYGRERGIESSKKCSTLLFTANPTQRTISAD